MKIVVPCLGEFQIIRAERLTEDGRWLPADHRQFADISLNAAGRLYHLERISGRQCWLYLTGHPKGVYRLMVREGD